MSTRPTREQVDAALADCAARYHSSAASLTAHVLAAEVRALRAEQAEEMDVAARALNDLRYERDELRAEVNRLRKVERDILSEAHDLMTGRGAGRRAATAALRARLAVLGGAS